MYHGTDRKVHGERKFSLGVRRLKSVLLPPRFLLLFFFVDVSVLSLQDFSKLVEDRCYAFEVGISVVHFQEKHL